MDQLFERVKAILRSPRTEWPVIAREGSDTAGLFTHYVAILALIPALAGFIGSSLIGHYVPVMSGLVGALVDYLLTFVVVFVVALIADALAPSFGAQKNFANALKLTAYSYSPFWLAGIVMLIPGLRFLTILGGLVSFYLVWLGTPPLMQAPRDKALAYAGAVVLAALIIEILRGVILGALFFSSG